MTQNEKVEIFKEVLETLDFQQLAPFFLMKMGKGIADANADKAELEIEFTHENVRYKIESKYELIEL
jgi:hypothetical protein